MITDEAKIHIVAGKGGDGAISFRHEKYVPKGGPDGGDGGKGGDIYLICSGNTHTLTDYARKKQWQAENGETGRPKKQTGKNAEDLELPVPPGTIVKIQNLNLKSQNDGIIYDFIKEGDRLLVAKGGRGGWGNTHFATAVHQTPYIAKRGLAGEEKEMYLELKLIADVGLIGLPNAGKSTLLSVISNARPKIADYPFTTLEPNLGVARYHDKEFVVADIPGLIEGASQGKGLGVKFLKHIERTKILIHLIDINSINIEKDYRVIREELKAWSENLSVKKEIIVLNKADTIPQKDAQKIARKLSKKLAKPVQIISAVSGAGIKELLKELAK
ncbi:MAG: GTPase ObgE [Patescibacteria group bacterium]|jgi:GTP-binding protein